MSDLQELDRIILTLIQSVALLLPVVFLTFRFYLELADESISENKLFRRIRLLIIMIVALTASGLFATIGLFDIGLKPLFTRIAVLTLAIFFLIYGLFIFKITKWNKLSAP